MRLFAVFVLALVAACSAEDRSPSDAERSETPIHCDDIALDQRGTGASDDTPQCKSSQVFDDTAPVSDDAFVEMHQAALLECLDFWSDQGIDPRGYTTLESVADLDALRVHLGVEKLSLWGISYGSHLALASVKKMGDRIERVVISSAEGLDQTIKQPARTDAYFDRLQGAIDTQPSARDAMPDIKATMHRVHAHLDDAPLVLKIPQDGGADIDVLFQRRDMQRIASGIGADRRRLIEEQAKSALLGRLLNDTLYLIDAAPSFDLGDGFREKPVSDVPLLLLSGTLDGRTYIESQREAVAGMTNAELVTVTNAGHNLFMSSPEVTATIQDFMRGESVADRKIVVELPNF